MGETLQRVRDLVGRGEVRVSAHGYDELANDGLFADEVVAGVSRAVLVEDYPDYAKGPCVLTLQHDGQGRPFHAVWGIPRGAAGPAVLVTAYRPDPQRWYDDLMTRRER